MSGEQAENLLKEGRFRADLGVISGPNGKLTNFWARPVDDVLQADERRQVGNFHIEVDSNVKEKLQEQKIEEQRIEEQKKENINSQETNDQKGLRLLKELDIS